MLSPLMVAPMMPNLFLLNSHRSYNSTYFIGVISGCTNVKVYCVVEWSALAFGDLFVQSQASLIVY